MFKIRKTAKRHTPGTIVYLIHDLARYDEFYECLYRTLAPEGTPRPTCAKGADIISKINNSIRIMTGDWI